MNILWNNQWVKPEEAVIPLHSEAVMYGLGAFETLRANLGGDIIKPEAHIDRLFLSLDSIGLSHSYTIEEILLMLRRVAENGKSTMQRMKIMVVPEGIAVTSEVLKIDPTIYNGIALKSVVQHRPLPNVKSLSYLECLLSYREAIKEGYFEALMIGLEGEVYEGSRSNIFWFDEDILHTRDTGVLPGITRQLVLDQSPFDIEYSITNLDDLKTKDEIFITSSTLGIVPVSKIDDAIIQDDTFQHTGKIWNILQKKFYK
ncbi:MAG: aminotransferase class IV [Candidatus Marinimicrobia bacterium]|nr:aminotransferase class IV [Candidatus Neomarinimicrobiota bacterium]